MSEIDTSPAALRAIASEWDINWALPYDLASALSETLRAVADEKEAGCTWAFPGWQDHLDACERRALTRGEAAGALAASKQIEQLQIGNNALLARIKELEGRP